MKIISFSNKYYDGTEIELGDTVKYTGMIGEIERIIYPNTKNCIDYNVKNGGILLRLNGSILYAFDFDCCEIEHLILLHRANIAFHVLYSARKFFDFIRNIKFFFRKCFQGNINEGLFFFKEWWFSILEFLQALIFGPGKYVTQMGTGECCCTKLLK
jgi:hypothetical protein